MKYIFTGAFLFVFAFAQDFDDGIVKTNELTFTVNSFSSGYNIPWGMTFLPNGEMLVSDLSGKLFRVFNNGKQKKEILGVPEVLFKRQGGLLDVEIHPDYKKNHFVYIAYSHQIGEKSFTRIARGALKEDRLVDFKIIFTADEKHYTSRAIHFGSRIIFYDNHIYFSIGDRQHQEEFHSLG